MSRVEGLHQVLEFPHAGLALSRRTDLRDDCRLDSRRFLSTTFDKLDCDFRLNDVRLIDVLLQIRELYCLGSH